MNPDQTAIYTCAGQCGTWFMKADSNIDEVLGQQEDASKYAGMISKSSVADALIIQKAFFVKYCGEGPFGMPSE